MKSSPIITSLNAGELSPTLEGRVDIAKYANGCKRIEGFLPLVQGPARRRGGTRFVAAVKDSAKRAWLVKFEFSATQAFMLEFGDQYVRFYTDDGVLLDGSDPYEIVSPYALADLTNADGTCALNFVQSGDVLYIANATRKYAPRKLTRIANTDWEFSIYEPAAGPLLEQNETATTIYASAGTGSVTLTATADLFAATDVGRLVRLDAKDISVKPWEVGKTYAANDLARFNGKTYKALNSATSGTSPPIHEQGSAYDGQSGVQWQYQDSGYGIARITAFTSATEISADVITDATNGLVQLPTDVVGSGNATPRWQLGAWSDTTEYPAVVTFFRDRLFWFGKQRLWGSVPADYENMASDFFGDVTADAAIARVLSAEDVNDILWAVGLDKLLIGTGGGEFVAAEITLTEPLGPNNFKVVRQSKRRSRGVAPVAVNTSLCFVQRAGRRLLSMDYDFEIDQYRPVDLAVLAEGITRPGIVNMAYQGEPYSIVWCVLSSGKLLGFTYDQEQQVTGWHRHPLGGTGIVESVATMPAPDGSREEVWLIVRRTVDGQTVRYVEFIEKEWEGADEDGTGGDAQADAFYVDAGLTYSGAAATHITGLDHLEGQSVQVLADGAVQPDKVVAGGAIDLDRAASTVQVGLQSTARLVTMRLEAGSQDGTSQGKIKRVQRCKVRFLDTLGGKVGLSGGTLDDISLRNPATPMDSAPPIASGDQDVDFPGDYDSDCRLEILQDQPLPMTVAAIMPQLRTYDP